MTEGREHWSYEQSGSQWTWECWKSTSIRYFPFSLPELKPHHCLASYLRQIFLLVGGVLTLNRIYYQRLLFLEGQSRRELSTGKRVKRYNWEWGVEQIVSWVWHKLYLMVNPCALGYVDHPFIGITPRPTLTLSCSTCYGLVFA